MKKIFFLLLLAALSIASGILMSHSTWIGKVGMTFFHKGYNLTKVWWQGAVAVYVVLLVLFSLHGLVQRGMSSTGARLTHFLLLLTAAAALYLTYDDFHHDFTHKLLGHKFHYGFYLGWAGWIMICVYFLFSRTTSKRQGRTETTTA